MGLVCLLQDVFAYGLHYEITARMAINSALLLAVIKHKRIHFRLCLQQPCV